MSQYYFFKLIPPRPTFPFDMSEQEKEIMNRHVAYWTDLMQKRTVVVFGPVLDPNGTYGIGVLELPEGQDPQSFADNDPYQSRGWICHAAFRYATSYGKGVRKSN